MMSYSEIILKQEKNRKGIEKSFEQKNNTN